MHMFFITAIFFILAGIYISLQDILTYHLPLKIIYLTSLIILFITAYFSLDEFLKIILSGVFSFLFYFFIRKISKDSLGMGDVHYSFLCALFSGINEFFYASFLSSVSGILFFLLFRKKRIPFAPFMFFSSLIVKLFHIMKIPELLWL